MQRRWIAIAALLLVGGCTQSPRDSGGVVTPPSGQAAPQIVPAGPRIDSTAPSTTAPPAIAVPTGALYVCVSERNGALQQSVIEFEPKVLDLCRRHPEMGPCQYQREVCRRSGGRVFAANGQEITATTEAEYDKRVMRVRLRSN